MKLEKIESEKEKLEKKKQKLLAEEKRLVERMKKMREKRLIKIGKLAVKAKIDDLDDDTLFGAFLDIAEQMKKSPNKDGWKVSARSFLDKTHNTQTLIVSFERAPGEEIADILKSKKFRFNKYRNEYYGSSDRKSLEEALSSTQYTIEIAED